MRKIFSLLMMALFSVGMWSAEGDVLVTISYTDIPDGFTATTGTSGSFTDTVKTDDDLTIAYAGINTKSSATAADHAYGYAMFLKNYGFIYNSTAPKGYYPSKVVATFTSNTGTTGKAGISFGSSALNTRNSSVNGEVSKSGTCELTNNDDTKLYWNFSTTGANVQIAKIEVTYSLLEEESTIKRLYCKVDKSWWTNGNAAVGVYTFKGETVKNAEWPGVRMSALEGVANVWYADVDTAVYSSVIFTRMNPSDEGDQDWGAKTADLTIPADKNLYTITSESAVWGNPGVTGSWSSYTPPTPTYYVAGTMTKWADEKVEMNDGSYTFTNLAAGKHQIKVISGSSWLGYDKLNKTASNANIYEGSDGNIKFQLGEAGSVTVAYDGKKITVTGATIVAPTTKFTVTVPAGTEKAFIAGNFNKWTPTEMTLQDSKFSLTIEGDPVDTAQYKYLAGTKWDYVEVKANGEHLDANRSYAEADVVAKWLAVPTTYKFAKVKAAPINWTGHYIIAWDDLKPHFAISGSDFAAGSGAPAFTDGDTIAITEGLDYAVDIRFSGEGYSIKLPNGKYLKVPSGNTMEESTAAVALYMGYYSGTNQTGVQIADKADLTSTATRMMYKNNSASTYRSYTNKINDKSYTLPTLYRQVDEAFDCQDGPYAILVNEDVVPTIAQTGDEEFDGDGRKQYLAYISVKKGDKIQVVNSSCGAKFLPTIEDSEFSKYFAVKDGIATVGDTTGCFNLYVKLKSDDNKIYIGKGICAGDTVRFTVRGKGGILGENFEKAIDSNTDTLELNLAAGKYELKVVAGSDWKGFDALTDTAAGLKENEDKNICFELKAAGKVKVVYNATTFKLIGDFYVRPIVLKDLKLVPGVWAVAEAKIAAWIWDKEGEMPAQWTPFFAGTGDTLSAKIDADADSIEFVRFADTVKVATWENEADRVWNKIPKDTIDWKDLTFTVTDWSLGTWKEYIPAKFYVAGDSALVKDAKFEGVAWNPKGLKSITDTVELTGLKANQEYKLALSLSGAWDETKKGFENLTEKTLGLYTDEDGNVCFKLNEAGIVKVVYIAGDKPVFKLIGDFVLPKISIRGEWDWTKEIVFTPALDKKTATAKLTVTEAKWYEFKFLKDGKYLSLPGEGLFAFHRGMTEAKGFSAEVDPNLLLQADKAGEYTFTWTYANDSVHIDFPNWEKFKVTIAPDENATITVKNGTAAVADQAEIQEGTKLYVAAAPKDADHIITGVHAYKGTDPKDTVFIVNDSLIMPTGALTITATSAFHEAKIAGTFNEWTGTALEVASDGKTASKTITLPFGPKQFKMIIDGNWLGNKQAITRAAASKKINGNNENATLDVDIAGDYTFTWNFKDSTLTVTYPAAPEEVTLYFVNRSKWDKVGAYFFTDTIGAKEWPGAEMTKTGKQIWKTDIYSVKASTAYPSVIFNNFVKDNGEQALAIAWSKDKPFYCEGKWYADTTEIAEFEPAKYYITGNEALVAYAELLPEAAWSPNAIKATKDTFVFENLPAGNYEMKVVTVGEESQWKGFDALTEKPKGLTTNDDNNICFSLTKAGNVTVVYTDKAFTVKGDYESFKVVALAGEFNSWNSLANLFTVAADSLTATLKLNLETGVDSFKVVSDGQWLSLNGEGEDAYRVHRFFPNTGKLKLSDTRNLILDKDVAGEYTFTWTYADSTLAVAFPNLPKDNAQYAVAGNTLALFYHSWRAYHDYGYTDLKQRADGVFEWKREEVKLPKGNVELKVCKDKSFDNSWPAENYILTIPENGQYTVTVLFNAVSHEILATAKKTGNATFHDPMDVFGSWSDFAEPKRCIIDEDNAKTLVTVSLEPGDYTFKFRNQDNKWFGNGEEFSRDNNFRRGIKADGADNMVLHADVAGDYIFTWIFAKEEVMISFPGVVPAKRISRLDGEFSVSATEKINFSRGNLQYNYKDSAWYTATKQYETLGDANLRQGDPTYQGSIDLFAWSCESSNYGLLASNADTAFFGDFKDWGALFEGDDEWRTMTSGELNYLLNIRKKDNHKLWATIAIGPDSLLGLAIFPDNWEAPAGVTINYAFWDTDDKAKLKANSYSMEQWNAMEQAGAVILPAGGARAGAWGNHITDGVKVEPTALNPLTGSYCWVNGNYPTAQTGYYWLSDTDPTKDECKNAEYFLFGEWAWGSVPYGNRERRRAHNIRLITAAKAPVYTVAGDSVLMGAKWNPEVAANNMTTVNEDTLQLQLKNITLDAGTYEYKIVKNQEWSTSWPAGDNAQLKITEDGIYDVTFLFDVATKKDSAFATLVKKIMPTIAIKGAWDWNDTIFFTVASDNKTASLKKTLAAGDFEFIPMKKGVCVSKENDGLFGLHRGYPGVAGVTAVGAPNFVLHADKAGEYTFTWTYANDSLGITFPAWAVEPVTIVAPTHSAITVKNGDKNVATGDKIQEGTVLDVTAASTEVAFMVKNLRAYNSDDESVAVAIVDGKLTMPGFAITITVDALNRGYAVAGDEALLGSSWNTSDPTSEMTKKLDGSYELIRTDREIPAGTYEYKIIVDHEWNQCYPAGANAQITIEKSGIYDITFTFNPNTFAVNAIPTLKKEIKILPSIAIKGGWDKWATALEFVPAADSLSASATLVINDTIGALEFKVLVAGSYRSNGYTFHRGFTGEKGISKDSVLNMILVTDYYGTYTFTWTYANDSLGIVFPAIPAPVYYLEGDFADEKIEMSENDGEWKVSVSIAHKEAPYWFKILSVQAPVVKNFGAQGEGYSMSYGNSTNWDMEENGYHVGLQTTKDGLYTFRFVPATGKLSVEMPKNETGVENTADGEKAVKVIRNGQLMIMKGDKTYTITGLEIR